jgi:hypothetical protein
MNYQGTCTRFAPDLHHTAQHRATSRNTNATPRNTNATPRNDEK